MIPNEDSLRLGSFLGKVARLPFLNLRTLIVDREKMKEWYEESLNEICRLIEELTSVSQSVRACARCPTR